MHICSFCLFFDTVLCLYVEMHLPFNSAERPGGVETDEFLIPDQFTLWSKFDRIKVDCDEHYPQK